MLGAIALPTSAQAIAQAGGPHAAGTSPKPPAVCPAATPNPTTDNVTDYRLDSNVVEAGRWSYESIDGETIGMLNKGGTGVFAADEWAAATGKAEHAWFVKADGSIGTDYRAIAETYTVPDAADGKEVHIAGSFTSPGGRFRVLVSHDGDPSAIGSPSSFTELFTYTGVSTSFDLTVAAERGDDILFVDDSVSTWWVPGKLKASVTTELSAPPAVVTSTPGQGAIDAGDSVKLSSKTAGACIAYTTDGTDPLTSSTAKAYSKPITITADTEIKAAAIAKSGAPSAVTDLPFVLNEPFRAFAGVNQAGSTGLTAGMQWSRQDFDWGTVEPAKGQIDQAALAEYVRQFTEAKAHGETILPVLDYTAGWAANRTGYSYDFHGTTYTYGPVLSEANGNFTRQLVTKDSHGKVLSSQNVQTNIGRTPPQNPADWTNFVKIAVDALKPLGITYFQV